MKKKKNGRISKIKITANEPTNVLLRLFFLRLNKTAAILCLKRSEFWSRNTNYTRISINLDVTNAL